MNEPNIPLGVVLAGGRSSRMGAPKAAQQLGGRSIAGRVVDAFVDAGLEAIVVAKGGFVIDPVDIDVWIEPDQPRHPLAGIVAALERGGGRPIVVCPCDVPFIAPTLLAWLSGRPAPLVVVDDGDRLQPLVGRYAARLLPQLRDALDRQAPMQETVAALDPVVVERAQLAQFGDAARMLFNVNTPADLERARQMLEQDG